jgi:hypothetical protein
MTYETEIGTGQQFQTRKEKREFRWIYAVIFTIALVPALFSRLTPWRRPKLAGEKHKSIIEEARIRTCAIVPFFFMG